jgi:hypothetical protein
MRSDPSFTELRVAAPLDRHRVEGVPAHSSRRHAHRGQQPGEEGGEPSAADSRLSRSCRAAHGSCGEKSRPSALQSPRTRERLPAYSHSGCRCRLFPPLRIRIRIPPARTYHARWPSISAHACAPINGFAIATVTKYI